MTDITEKIRVLHHSSIRLEGDKLIIYVDPFEIEGEPHDADLILITHEHFDHFSPEDIERVKKDKTDVILPESMAYKASELELSGGKIYTIRPDELEETEKLVVKAIPAYNKLKPFHTKKAGWVGYIFELNGEWIYVAGDTDLTEEASKVKCDIALVPIGGKFTMDAKKAAELVNMIQPQVAIPTHYGSVAGKKEDEEVFAALVKEPIKTCIKMEKY